jgi:hypothetical protein
MLYYYRWWRAGVQVGCGIALKSCDSGWEKNLINKKYVRFLGWHALAFSLSWAPAFAADKVLYESDHIRFVEVTRAAGEIATVDDEKLPAVVAVDAVWPKIQTRNLHATAARRSVGAKALPPQGRRYPWCRVEEPHAPYSVRVVGTFPQHFYRIEYKRIDGDTYAANWRSYYPWLAQQAVSTANAGASIAAGSRPSADYPYPPKFDPTVAAPANHLVRYEDDHVQLVEVVIRPGEKENMHGHPYSSVFADDGGGFAAAILLHNDVLDPKSINPRGSVGLSPAGNPFPQCWAAVPEWPHQVTVTGEVPQHFYRLHFKYLEQKHLGTQHQQRESAL